MKRILLLLSMVFILSTGLSSCADETADELIPEHKFENQKVETDVNSGSPVRRE